MQSSPAISEAKAPPTTATRLGDWAPALAFLAPALLLMVLFKLWPILSAMGASLGEFNPAGTRVGDAGLANFQYALGDERFRHGLWLNLLAGLVKVPLHLVLGLTAALLVQQRGTASYLLRTLLISPLFLGLPVTSLLFAYIFDSRVGFANAFLGTMGIDPIAWLTSERPAQFVVIALAVWRDIGLTTLTFLAGLSAIPKDILAAARLDGAGPITLLWTMVWPLLARSVQLVVVMTTLGSFQLVVPVVMLTSGGPSNATDLASFQIYETGFEYFDFGRASAMSLILVATLFVIVALELRWLRVDWKYSH